MHSFIYLPRYRIVVCKECKFGVVANAINAHLRGEKHKDVSKKERRRIVAEITQIPGVIKEESELKDLPFPPPTSEAIPELEHPQDDGIRCNMCPYISRQRQGI
jgi:hypothetical protein